MRKITLLFFLLAFCKFSMAQTTNLAPTIKQVRNDLSAVMFTGPYSARKGGTYEFEIDTHGTAVSSINVKIGNISGDTRYFNETFGNNIAIPKGGFFTSNGTLYNIKVTVNQINAGDLLYYQMILRDTLGNPIGTFQSIIQE